MRFSPTGYPAGEGDGTVKLTVTLSPAAAQVVTVQWSTQDGSAKAGEDYVAGSDTLVFQVGET